ncbi:MAG TPA: hypothetical protein VHW64_09405 [Nocardioides sp.]|uniref:hypothetical protein n=1 Tax=Nocardioides sp. TaxID=35761 RepID=UPI002E300DBB|nr:hypothetical protein [Nocardioides sp.]HEX3930909.1 hypothetical protein [Nocardioides sp.]
MIRLGSLVATIALLLGLAGAPTQASSDRKCHGATDIGSAGEGCVQSATQTLAYIAENSSHTFKVEKACTTDNAICSDTPTCDGGLVYNIWEDGNLLPWQACLNDDQAAQITGLTPGFVERAYQRLTWPASDLLTQPPGGKTLVNFATNFYTTNTHPTTQTVTLLGQHITIEATPTQYTWHFDDHDSNQSTLTTTDPGAPYPNLQITHRYTRADTAHPSLETTYTGRYRVNQGPWHTIPDTLTVPGTNVDLQILTATPHLVG